MSIHSDLAARGAPKRILEAGKEIDRAANSGLTPPRELVIYVRDWVSSSQRSNRYGK